MYQQGQGQISWLDYTINNNLNGVLKVLSEYGYIGMLAPQTLEQVKKQSIEVMNTYGDTGTVSLLKAHPEFEAFSEIFGVNENNKFNNAIGGVTSQIDSFVSRLKPINQGFLALGVFLAVYYIIQETKK